MNATQFKSIAEVKKANKAIGQYWFNKETMAFFDSKIESKLIEGQYFISSEYSPWGGKKYTIRIVSPIGAVDTVGEFGKYETKEEALIELGKILGQGV